MLPWLQAIPRKKTRLRNRRFRAILHLSASGLYNVTSQFKTSSKLPGSESQLYFSAHVVPSLGILHTSQVLVWCLDPQSRASHRVSV